MNGDAEKTQAAGTAEATRGTVEPEALRPILQELTRNTDDPRERQLRVDFAHAFHFRTPAAYFSGTTPAALAREVVSALDFIRQRSSSETHVRTSNEEEGGYTLLQANKGDHPFILDTVQEVLRVKDIAVRSFIHPILQVDRDTDGRLVAVGPRTAPGAHESLLHFKLEPIESAATLEAVRAEVRASLADAERAVGDFYPMKARVDGLARELQLYPARDLDERRDLEETIDFLRWLLSNNFIFLGFRSYRYQRRDEELWIAVATGSGLGVLRDERSSAFATPTPLSSLPEDLQKHVLLRQFPLIRKSHRLSRVHRRAPLDLVEIKQLNADGEIVGTHRIVGLLTADAYNQASAQVPVLRRKLRGVLNEAQVLDGSHEYKQIYGLFNSLPRVELFATETEKISQTIREILESQADKAVRIACRTDVVSQGLAVMVIIPRDQFNAAVRMRVQEALSGLLDTPAADYRLALSEEATARMHFYFQNTTRTLSLEEISSLEARVVRFLRTWEDDFRDALEARLPAAEALALAARYCPALPQSYRASVLPEEAASDVELFERMRRSRDVEVRVQPCSDLESEKVSLLRLIRPGEKYLLSDIMPVLNHLGLIVIDEATFRMESAGCPRFHLHTFRVQTRRALPVPADRQAALEEAIRAILNGHYESDRLNELVVHARLSVRQTDLVRMYVHYFRQIGALHRLDSIALALSTHAALTELLVEYFETKFAPHGAAPARQAEERLESYGARLHELLEGVSDINEDRIIRGLAGLISATVRTNYFQKGGTLPRIAVKIRSSSVQGMPRPVPLFEIFVHSRRMEGIHLRSGPVARGGIRWSDRRDDFRTEILGLMRTQVTKNSVIVPVGSKGGFILKCPPEKREDLAAEVELQYRELISGLLDLTDNRVGKEVVHPPDTVVYDKPDPYLVVAADKGTAAFSDVGNELAAAYGFWLDDAFASGGSQGYDHKKYGITARGAWECVRHHFLELGLHVDRDLFTVVGIGDMSGDVFGNGLLLSRKAKLVAAFDHRHIFVDPDPDPETTFAERRRLFEKPRSSWDDFDRGVLSEGGGVFARSAKRITFSTQIRHLLEIEQESLSGEELIQAILRLPVGLLYNGGIGTYVKARHESHEDAHDERNDPVRVSADELRCRVVAEGGNLGLTPAARVEYAARGGRVNTDFIDNSGGVELSDREVNIKIALGLNVQAETLDMARRNEILRGLGPAVCEQVLFTNRSQSLVLSLEEAASRADTSDHLGLLAALQRADLLDPTLDEFPDAATLARRVERDLGFLRPELATLLSFSKIEISRALLATPLAKGHDFEAYLDEYFPEEVVAVTGERLPEHPLRDEIIITCLINEMVYRCGITLIHRLRNDLGSSIREVARAYRASDLLLDGRQLFAQVEALLHDGALAATACYDVLREYRGALADVAAWLVRSWPLSVAETPCSVAEVVARLAPWYERGASWLAEAAPEEERRHWDEQRAEAEQAGVPADLAERTIRLRVEKEIPPLIDMASRIGSPPAHVAQTYFVVQNALRLKEVLTTMEHLPVRGPDDRGACRALIQELRALAVGLTARVLTVSEADAEPDQAVGTFLYDQWDTLQAYLETIESASRHHTWSIATGIMLSERLRRLADIGREREPR